MPRKGKIGKQRKDRFYQLAKETGYRSRASFKLIQLNRKFEFLQKSRVLIDLCAAPGGWLQVAQQTMPVSSVIIGVDLVAIKPIPNVITLQDDITTDHCRQALRKQLQTWKADVVLHDGAPNIGKNWLHDAFSQNHLTLSALKLATGMLAKGGWFISKVFRSKDYLSLIWIFKKLFRKVDVTKPQASRNESAEIFVVCQGYTAPDRIDPKFLDPAYAFKDMEGKGETKANILQISKEKQKAEGYEGDESVYNQLKASDFVFSEKYLELLSNCTEIVFDEEDIRDHKLTTEEIKECCKDIKVLGKGDLRSLLSWRKSLRQAAEEAKGVETSSDLLPTDVEEQELDDAEKEAEDLELEKLQDAKRKKKKVLKERRKINERINLKMIIRDDDPIIQEERELFNLSQIKNKAELNKVESEDDLEFDVDPQIEIQDDLPSKGRFRSTFVSYDRHSKDELYDDDDDETEAKEEVDSSDEELEQDIDFESDNESVHDKASNDDNEKTNPLVVDLVSRNERVKDTVARWFDRNEFGEMEEDNDLELALLAENLEKKKKAKKQTELKSILKKRKREIEDKTEHKEESAPTEDEVQQPPKKKKKKKVRLDPEGLALGSLIVQSKKMKRDIIDSAYNRYACNDENLPDWFVKDEEKHFRKHLPVTAEMVQEYRARLREINARPIKKVIEAKTRKKRRAVKRMERARKKAEAITDDPHMNPNEKTEQLKSIYKKAQPKKDKSVTYVVAKKGVGKRVKRPQGVKGRFKVVDSRMKKDNRKQKIWNKQQKKPKAWSRTNKRNKK